MKNFELFYDFCGTFDEKLKKDYRKSKIKDKGVTFPQFCVTMFANLIEESNQIFNIKSNKKMNAKR
jgi:hypothetical protein